MFNQSPVLLTHYHPPRKALALLILSLLVSSVCQAGMPWPKPSLHRPSSPPFPTTPDAPPVLKQPNFDAPSATHCSRPIQTYEAPGFMQPQESSSLSLRRGSRSEAGFSGDARASISAAAVAEAEAPAPTAARNKRSLSDAFSPAQPPQRPMASTQQTVTAGMVDDNANFSEYLAFRARTSVAHRPRDISERYLLELKDAAERPVADAEIIVRASQGGATMWARTDTAGRAWLHPNAFDADRESRYEVHARKGGRQSQAVLQRGRKSTLEMRLDTQASARTQLDLVFLIDATGSMADEIDKLKASMRSIAAEVARLPSRPDLCFGLVAYRDKTDQFVLRSHDLTNDLNAFQGVLNALQADGGGDYPEAMNEALDETVHGLSWRGDNTTRLVILLADAPPHLDYAGPQYDNDMLAALGKGIKVFSVGASGLDPQGEFIQRQIAQYTGGRFVFLTYAQADNAASGPGRETVHDVRNYSVDTLDRLVVRLIREELAPLRRKD